MRTFIIMLLALVLSGGLVALSECSAVASQNDSQPADEQAPTPCIRTPDGAACETGEAPHSLFGSPVRFCGNAVNRFFSFGCRVNYRLTDWMLSDKCEEGPAANAEVLPECGNAGCRNRFSGVFSRDF